MRNILLPAAAIIGAASMHASPITPDQALDRLAGGSLRVAPKVATAPSRPQLEHTALTADGAPAAYVMSAPGVQGYMVLSADDIAAPLLGYSDSGTFDADNMPEAMAWWLEEYARQIEYAASKGASPYVPRAARADREAIAPMTATKWDQASPYNDLCPKEGAQRTYTGCVATSMAQIAKYWQYPEKGKGNIRYTASTLGKTLSLNFSNITFDWKNMKDDYSMGYTEEEGNAVATLMRACGYAVKMNYSTSASAALALNIADGMIKYLDYDPHASYELRSFYPASQWEEMIYDNLKNVGPIPYGGTSMTGGGHSFVCDGYDGNGYFHFNWGWSGMSDGYFLLDALNPESLGIGGGMGGGYNFSQDAVLGLQPPTGKPVENRPMQILQAGSLTATVDDGKIKFGLEGEASACWLNFNAATLKVVFGATFQPIDSTPDYEVTASIEHSDPLTMRAGYGTGDAFEAIVDMNKLDLADGTYKVTMVTRESSDPVWTPVRPFYPYSNYVTLRKQGSEYTVIANEVPHVRIIDGGFNTKIYYGAMTKVWVKVANDSDDELSRGFAPALYFNEAEEGSPAAYKMYFLGSSKFVTVPPHSELEVEWETDLNTTIQSLTGVNKSVEMQLSFFDEATYYEYINDFSKDVTMYANPGLPNISMTSLEIAGATKVVENVPSQGGETDVYLIDNKNAVQVNYTARLRGNIPFCYEMLAVALSSAEEADGQTEILAYGGHPVFLTRTGLSPYVDYDFSTTLSVPTMQPGKYYLITGAFITSGSFSILGNNPILYVVRLNDTSGISDVITDSNVPADDAIYNLQGICMGCDWDALPPGLYICGGKKILK